MRWTIYQTVIIIIFVVSGAINTLSNKFADLEESKGIDGVTREYMHPFVQSCQMFLAMSSNLFLFKILFCSFKRKSIEMAEEHKLTKGNRKFNVLILWLPASCDMIGTSTALLALNLTYASSYQMLRGAVIIFTALLSVPIFHRVPHAREIAGIFLVIIGLTVVGVSDYLDKSDSDNAKEMMNVIIGDVMVVLAQFLTATQGILEEKFLVDRHIPPLQAVGWEGIFGFSSLSLLLIPMYFIYVGERFSNNARGTLEDVIDAFVQIGNNWRILVATIVNICCITVYNFCALTVGVELSATTRQVLDSVRTIIIWGYSLCFFGQNFQYMQLIGFILLLAGMGFYNDTGCSSLRKKCFPPKAESGNQEEQK
ncbi:hypothetical protein HHI36_021406 [Cryptolaemus montrouzieri]|uniref:Solute carrier family 35 member F6 n=1 Tax=Cryptolaemus montrouzieri TaxID=559131 RepID=A0ABD2MWV6_9CUCU